MRLIKVFGLVAIAAAATVAFVGATTASATSTQLCDAHTGLTCGGGDATESVHLVLAEETVGKLLSPISVLCLGVLAEAGIGKHVLWIEFGGFKFIEGSAELSESNKPQVVQLTSLSFTGCGTGSAHSNCTVTVEALPIAHLLKIGLNVGVLSDMSFGRVRLQCANLGINCLYDTEGAEFAVGANHFTAEETPIVELGGKFFCPDEGLLDGLLQTLTNVYVLG